MLIIEESIANVLYFGGKDCRACKIAWPIIEKLKEACAGREIEFHKIDIDEEPELAENYEVTSLPTVIFFSNGKEIGREIGTKQKGIYEKLIAECLK